MDKPVSGANMMIGHYNIQQTCERVGQYILHSALLQQRTLHSDLTFERVLRETY